MPSLSPSPASSAEPVFPLDQSPPVPGRSCHSGPPRTHGDASWGRLGISQAASVLGWDLRPQGRVSVGLVPSWPRSGPSGVGHPLAVVSEPAEGGLTLTGLLTCPQLEKKQALPPFQPQITDDSGLDNFDTQFTSEPVQLTPDDE